MSKNEVSIFQAGQVPAHIAAFNEAESNIKARANGDTLTYKGKVWSVTVNGAKTVLMKKDENGDEEPRTTIPVVILGYADRRGRSYYPDGYTDGAAKAPSCWSKDGIKPDEDVAEKQSLKCATCPMSVKGSKVTEAGVETKACAEFLNVAVQLYRKWDTPPLRLRLAVTSIYDARDQVQKAKNFFAFQQYCDMLRAQGVNHTASVATRLKFDPATSYPKVLFSSAAWLPEDELEIVADIAKSDIVKDLLNPVFDAQAAPADEKPVPAEDPEEDGPITKPVTPKPTAKTTAKTQVAPVTAKPKTKPAPAPVEDDESDGTDEAGEALDGDVVDEGGETATDVTDLVEANEEEDDEERQVREAEEKAKALRDKIAARKAAETTAAKGTSKAVKAAAADDDDGEETITVAPPKAAAKAATAVAGKVTPSAGKVTAGKTQAAPKGTPAGKPAPVSAEVGAIIDDW